MPDFTEFPIPVKEFNPADFAGANGREIELTKSATHIQWRYVGEAAWLDLLALDAIEGADGDDGPAIELQTSATHIQWRVAGDVSWIDLIALSELKGSKGDDAVLPDDIITGEGFSRIAIVAEGTVPDPPVNGVFYFEVPPEALP